MGLTRGQKEEARLRLIAHAAQALGRTRLHAAAAVQAEAYEIARKEELRKAKEG